MKLAILSGTFNPIHNAHISLAKYVKEHFDFDKILLIPAFNPPFKDLSEDSSHHRMNMVKLAAEKCNDVEVSDIEFQSEGKSYSYLTVKKLYEMFKLTERPSFVIGTDAYVSLPKWHEANKLKELVDFIVFEREIPFDNQQVQAVTNQGFNMIKAELPFRNISSTEIRNRVKSGRGVSELMPKEVVEYIEENELYK